MKLHERLFELRRKVGLSQEELAEHVGVSRQAVSKWENGSSVPELDKLLALVDFYGLSIGELLGLETPPAGETDTGETDTGKVRFGELEELLRGLTESQRAAEKRAGRQRRFLWMALGAAGAAIALVAAVLGSRVLDLRGQVSGLSSQVASTHNALSNEIFSLQSSLQEIMKEQNSLFLDWESETLAFDQESRELTVRLFAKPKSMTESLHAEFLVTDEDGREYKAEAVRQGSGFVAEIRLPQSAQELPPESFFPQQGAEGDDGYGVMPPDPLDGNFTLTAVLTDGETTRQEELGTFFAGPWQIAGEYRFAWYSDPTAEGVPTGLLAVYADGGREVISAELVSFVNGEVRVRMPLDMGRADDWYREFTMPEKYADRHRAEGDVSYSVPGRLTPGDNRRLFVRELTLTMPDAREGDAVSFLLELTDDRDITYAGLLFATTTGKLPGDTDGDMTPVLK